MILLLSINHHEDENRKEFYLFFDYWKNKSENIDKYKN